MFFGPLEREVETKHAGEATLSAHASHTPATRQPHASHTPATHFSIYKIHNKDYNLLYLNQHYIIDPGHSDKITSKHIPKYNIFYNLYYNKNEGKTATSTMDQAATLKGERHHTTRVKSESVGYGVELSFIDYF